MNATDSEWGFLATFIAVLLILGVFGSALWFIFFASRTNKKFRWLQIVDRRDRQQRNKTAQE